MYVFNAGKWKILAMETSLRRYGTLESFRDYVRGPLQKELLEKLKINSLPFSYIIIVGTPFISLEMDLAMAIWNASPS